MPSDILPTEFGGSAGDLDNLPLLGEVLKLEDFFQELKKSYQEKIQWHNKREKDSFTH